jgi:DNA-binding transcriptional ArsR family regulator
MTYANALAALADPTRRRVFERLRAGPKPVGQIAKGLPVSRPAVSQHLKVLREAGLVSDRAEGASRVYAIDPKGLGQVRRWLDQFWDDALLAFKAEAEATASSSEAVGQKKMTAPKKKEDHE